MTSNDMTRETKEIQELQLDGETAIVFKLTASEQCANIWLAFKIIFQSKYLNALLVLSVEKLS